MAIDINKVREKYSTNRDETLRLASYEYHINLPDWTYTEISAKEVKGIGNDVLVIFEGTFTKPGEETIYITEIIDCHRLKYSYSFRYGEPEVIPPEEEGEDE